MKIHLKPIQFNEIKEEITILIDDNMTFSELCEKISIQRPEIGKGLEFMFRGKKMNNQKTLADQGIKDGTKLMMYKSSKEEFKISNKDSAKLSLINQGYQIDLIESVIKSIKNVETLSSDVIIEKSLNILKSYSKEFLSEYTIGIDEANSLINIDENNITSVFTMGNGIQGQLGVGKYIKTDFPFRVNKLRNLKIKSISCGVYHTTALTFNGHVYFWGRYYMPISDENTRDYKTGDNPYPTLIESLTNELIVEIGSGSNHSIAINDKGNLFTWGEGIYGQLGHGILNNEYYPRKIENLKNFRFKYVTGGATHSIAVTHDDYIFGWGSNEKNQLNLRLSKHSTTPVLIPLYDLLGNYSIDEIINLNLDDNFNKMLPSSFKIKPKLTTEPNEISIDSNQSIENQNDLSYNFDELMKIKLIACGTWFTVCTSQMFPSNLYIFGNNFRKLIKITYFEFNRLEIKQISASNYNICVLTTDNGVYKINLNNLVNLKTNCEAEKLEHLSLNFEIEKLGCGYDYLILHTKNNQAIYNFNFEKGNYQLLNSVIKTNVREISTGPGHFFIISSLNELNFGDFLYDEIQNYINKIIDDLLYHDIYIKDKTNSFEIPCHSFYLEQFIKLEKLISSKNKNNTYISIPLGREEILTFLELIYTSNLKVISTEESKKVIENPEILRNTYNQLMEILSFLNDPQYKLENENYGVLITLIEYYIEQISQNLEYERMSEEFNRSFINKKLSESCNFILNNIMKSKVKHNLSNLRNDNNILGRDDIDIDLDNPDNFNNHRSNRGNSYFEKFENKGTKIDVTRQVSSDFYDINQISIDLYITKQNELIDHRYQFYLKILKMREKFNNLKNNYIRHNKNPNFSFKIIDSDKEEIEINKLMIAFKSIYFSNFIKMNRFISDSDGNFNINSIGISYSKECLRNMTKFLKSENFSFNAVDLFEMLDLASYFMMDNLSTLIEIELERIVSKIILFIKIDFDNVICLLEIAKDYSLSFLMKSCLFFLLLNFPEAKNKGLFKYIKDEDRNELKRLMILNNKSEK